MSKLIHQLINESVNIEISGKKKMGGTIIESGSDTIVLFNGKDYVYIPIIHIQNIKVDEENEYDYSASIPSPSILSEDELSLRRVLTQAKGMFVEIYITGKQPIHGFITSIMNNYFVFHSPIFKTMYITIHHLKWLIPYLDNQRPYGLESHNYQIQTQNTLLARTFDVQIEKFKDKVVIFDIGDYIGKINNVDGKIIELQTARENPVIINIHHIKTLHQV